MAALGVVAGSWVGLRGLAARDHLTSARGEISALRSELVEGRTEGLDRRIATVQRHARRARALTSDPVWSALARVPYAGRTLRTGAGVATAVDELAKRALPSLDEAAEQLDPKLLRPRGNRIDVARLAAAEAPLDAALDVVDAQLARLRRLPQGLIAPQVGGAYDELLDQLTDLRRSAVAGRDAADIAPGMLGAAGPRRYLVMFLNNSEMRGSGGFFGAYGVLDVDDGRFDLTQVGPNEELIGKNEIPFVDLGPEYRERYERNTRGYPWQNANLSPHFPYAGQIWSTLWRRTRGTSVDGVIAVDPPALSGILKATGPAALASGEQLTADNIVAITESDAYRRYPDGVERDAYLVSVIRAVYAKLVSGSGDQQALLEALGATATRRHVNVWSAHEREQAALEPYPVSGALPPADGSAFLLVTTQAAGANKLDYWIRREIDYARESADAAVVRIRLTNTAPAGLPAYVTGTPPRRPGESSAPGGRQLLYVSVYLSAQSSLAEARLDGEPMSMESEIERGHPVFSQHVHIDPGQTVELGLTIEEPGDGRLTLIEPPLVVPDVVLVEGLALKRARWPGAIAGPGASPALPVSETALCYRRRWNGTHSAFGQCATFRSRFVESR